MYLNHNYGAQGILFPFIDKINNHFDAEFGFISSEKCYDKDKEILRNYGLNAIKNLPAFASEMARNNPFLRILINVLYLIKKGKWINSGDYGRFFREVKSYDVFINLSGIQFIGNAPTIKKYLLYNSVTRSRWIARNFGKLNLEYTKSYGPFLGKFYCFLIKKHFRKLPFLFVRGDANLKEVEKLNLKIPIYSFPDISLSMEPENRNWALSYFQNLGLDYSKKISGISPSAVISGIKANNNSSSGNNHLVLCKKIIDIYKENGNQVIILPHSIGYGAGYKKNNASCDLTIANEVYKSLQDKTGVFLIRDRNLTYRQTRSLIGLLDFYVTGRYHSVSSALFMGVPIISMSWHVKYKDIMSLFFDDPPIVDCRKTSIESALAIVKEYYCNRTWFNREIVLERKRKIIGEIDKSISLVVDSIMNNYKGD
jgi:polysaccharide pyruvyl transferase WcaK-like protein